MAPSFTWLRAFRGLQGFASGAGIIVGRAVIRARFEGSEAHKLMSQVTMLFRLVPAIAPILDSYLHTLLGWQAVFVFLALFGGVMLAASARFLPKTLSREARAPFHLAPLARSYLEVFSNARFVVLVCSLGLGFGGFLLYVAAASDMVLNVLGLSELRFAWLFVLLVIGLVGGSWLVNLTAGRVAANRLAFYGYLLMFGGAAFNPSIPPFLPCRCRGRCCSWSPTRWAWRSRRRS